MRRGALALLIGAALVLVLLVRASWRSPDHLDAVFAESDRVAERLLAEHLARGGRRPTLGEPLPDLDARTVYDDVLPRFGELDEETVSAHEWMVDRAWSEPPGAGVTAAALKASGVLLERLRPVLRAPRQSPVEPWRGPEPDYGYIRDWQTLSHAASAHVHQAVRQGRIDEAIDLCVLRWFAGLDLARRGPIVNALVGLALGQVSAEELGWILAQCVVTPERLARLARELDVLRAATPAHEHAWHVEEYILRRSTDLIASEARKFLPATAPSYITRKFQAQALAQLGPTLERMEVTLRGAATIPDALARGEELATALKEQVNPLVAMVVVLEPLVFDRARQHDLRLELLRVAVAVGRFRLQHARDPETLGALVPAFLTAMPTCPYSGAPFRLGAGTVWSIGGDGTDDGGMPVSWDEELQGAGDVVQALYSDRLRTFPWPDEVDAATRATVEDAVKELRSGGAAAESAADLLAGQDPHVCGRLISEFRRIEEGTGFDKAAGRRLAAGIDDVLRRIDGFMDDKWRATPVITADTDPTLVRTIALRWTNWWRSGVWSTDPRDPVERYP